MSTPAWISSLPTGVVRTDLLQDATGGVLTYADALQVLTDVAALGAVTASEFSALQTVAANLNNGLTASPEVASLFTQLVDGSPANATWTGGAAGATTPLGDLKAGTTTTQLNELIGQWFLGANLPDPTVSGSTGTPYPYTAISAPLYGASGAAVVSDICQGSDGDCELMAGLVDMVEKHPQQLASMIVANPNGTWGVRFYVDGDEVWETVNDALPTFSGTALLYSHNPNYANTALWVGLVEKAYAQLSATGLTGHPAVDSYANINADPPTDVLPNLSDATQVNYFVGSSSNFYADKAWYIDAVDSGDDVILESWGNTNDSSGKMQLIDDHAFAVVGYDAKTGDFIVRNPWGAQSSSQNWDTQFEVSLANVVGVKGDFVIDNSAVDKSQIRLNSQSGQILANTPTSVAMFFAAADTTGAAATRYNLQLLGGASIKLNGAVNLASAAQTALGQIVVSASDLAKVTITAAADAGQQDLLVSACDGKAWSATTDIQLTVSPTSATMNPALSVLVAVGGAIPVSSLFAINAPGAEWYAFSVPNGGGVINLNGATNYASQSLYEVTASQLSLLTYTPPASGGSVTLEGEVYVGSAWTNWQNVQVNVGVSVGAALLDYADGALAAAANVTDSAANIFAHLTALQGAFQAGELTLIGATDTTLRQESLSQAQYAADLGVLSILRGDVELTVTSANEQIVLGGATVSGGAVASGAEQIVWNGGVAHSTNVTSGGKQLVQSGASASGSLVSSGGVLETLAGGDAVAAILSGGQAFDFGAASGDMISSGGLERVEHGGVDSGALVYGGGRLLVSSGGLASATTVDRGGTEVVYSGGVARGTVLSGTLTVSSGGSIVGGLSLRGGEAVISGTMAAGLTAAFASTSGVLALDNLAGFHAKISGLSGAGDKVDLGGFAFASGGETVTWAPSGTSGTLTVTDGAKVASLTLIGSYAAASSFKLSNDGHGGTFVTGPAATPSAASFVQVLAGFSPRSDAVTAAAASGGTSGFIEALHAGGRA